MAVCPPGAAVPEPVVGTVPMACRNSFNQLASVFPVTLEVALDCAVADQPFNANITPTLALDTAFLQAAADTLCMLGITLTTTNLNNAQVGAAAVEGATCTSETSVLPIVGGSCVPDDPTCPDADIPADGGTTQNCPSADCVDPDPSLGLGPELCQVPAAETSGVAQTSGLCERVVEIDVTITGTCGAGGSISVDSGLSVPLPPVSLRCTAGAAPGPIAFCATGSTPLGDTLNPSDPPMVATTDTPVDTYVIVFVQPFAVNFQCGGPATTNPLPGEANEVSCMVPNAGGGLCETTVGAGDFGDTDPSLGYTNAAGFPISPVATG